MSAASIKASAAKKRASGSTANRNYSTSLAGGGSVTVRNGVKTYSDKPLQVKGKGGISISGKDYSVNKGGTGFAPATSAITAEALKPTPKLNLAIPAPTDGLFGQTGISNASLAGGMGGTYDVKTGQIVPAPEPTEPPKTANDAYTEMFNASNAALNKLERPSYEDAFNKTQKALRPKENLRNSLAGQLNVIQADSNAAQLALEGQGRGQTSGFIGGEQARINREAAIKSMPIQAQLAIAQDDLDSARSYYTQYYQAKMQDEQNTYNLKKENLNNLYGFLTAQETRRQAASEKLLDREYAEKQQLMTAKAEMISKALGQGAPAAVQQAIDNATSLAGVATAAGKYNGDLLAQEAQRASIAASRASTANSYDAIEQRAEQNKALLGTLNGKAQTEGERLTQVYATRMLEANDVIDQIGSQFTSTRVRLDEFLPNELLSENRQKYDQAQRNFVNAVLRKESGAVISDEEFTSAKLQYFPQPGDSAGTIAQKKQNRNTAISGLYNAANVPMPELVEIDSVTPLQSGYKGVTSSGITYTIE